MSKPLKIIVTGGTGFIGRALLSTLIARGHDAVPLSRSNKDMIGKFKPDACVDLAWSAHATAQERARSEQIEENLTRSTLLVRELARANCKSYLGIGSQAEYGVQNQVLTPKSEPCPETPYGVAKYRSGLETQRLCSEFGMKHAWLRLLTAYGPGDSSSRLIPYAIRQSLRGLPIEATAGEQQWDFLYLDDCSKALALAVENQLTGFYPLGSGETYSLRQVLALIKKLAPRPAEIRFGARPYAPLEIFLLKADIGELSCKLGWAPEISLAEGLRRTFEYEMAVGAS